MTPDARVIYANPTQVLREVRTIRDVTFGSLCTYLEMNFLYLGVVVHCANDERIVGIAVASFFCRASGNRFDILYLRYNEI
jgi:hypothetical protein